jgi:hypothetical protein
VARVLPVIIIAVVAIPVLAIAFFATRRTDKAVEHPAGETEADRLRTEQEFADAEAYQEKWREEQHKEHPPESLY